MFSFGKKLSLPMKKIRERQTVEVSQLFGELHKVVCTTCQRALQNEDSMIAGMGAVCRERARFAERLTREELKDVEGKKEPTSTGLYPARNAVMRIKGDETPRFVSILSVNNFESNLMDRTEMSQIYEKTGSMAEAISESIYTIEPQRVYSLAPAVKPKQANVAKKFNRFQKNDRKNLKERIHILKDGGLDDTYYQLIEDKKSLTEDQLAERNNLVVMVEGNVERRKVFQEGHYHLATLCVRLDKVFMPEAKKLRAAIYNPKILKEKGVKEKDYGLTDMEMLRHLVGPKSNERVLIKAFFRGNKNFPVMVELYNKSKMEKGMNKVNALKTLKIFDRDKITPQDYPKIKETFKALEINKKFYI